MTPERPTPALFALLTAGLVLLTVATHRPGLKDEFLRYADDRLIGENFMIDDGVSAGGLRWAATSSYGGLWRPLTWLSHMLDFGAFGAQARAHYATQLGVHVLGVCLLFLALAGVTSAVWRSALAAALFAVHPLQAEPVAWLAQRGVLLAFVFGLLALIAYDAGRRGSRIARWAAPVAVAASLSAHPLFVSLPLLLPLLDVSRKRGASLRQTLPFAALALPVFGMAAWLSAIDATRVPELAPHFADLAVEPVRVFLDWFWPAGLSVRRVFPQDTWAFVTLAGCIVIGTAVALAARHRRTGPWLHAGVLGFLALLLPAVLLGERGVPAHEAYAAHALLAVGTSWGLGATLARAPRPAITAVVAAGVVALAVWGHAQSSAWRNHAALFERVLELHPDDGEAHGELGIALAARGDHAAALAHHDAALRARPDDAAARANRGWALTLSGDAPAGVLELQRALQAEPLLRDGAFHLAVSLERANRLDEAIEWHVEQLGLDPSHHGSLLHLARLRAAHPDPAQRDGAAAVAMCNRACALGGCETAWELDVFGMALMEAGRPTKAVALAQRASAAALLDDDAEFAARIEARMRGYAEGRPFRIERARP